MNRAEIILPVSNELRKNIEAYGIKNRFKPTFINEANPTARAACLSRLEIKAAYRKNSEIKSRGMTQANIWNGIMAGVKLMPYKIRMMGSANA